MKKRLRAWGYLETFIEVANTDDENRKKNNEK